VVNTSFAGAYAQMQLVKRTSPDLKLTVAIGGWSERSEKFSKMAASPSLRKTFIDSVLEYLKCVLLQPHCLFTIKLEETNIYCIDCR
jgi:GH18 family chitinase